MNKTMTKEELQKELGKKETLLELQLFEDKRVKQEFAKAFDWGEKGLYDIEWKSATPSWEQIFVKVGKLLANQKNLNYITEQETLKIKVQEIENKLREDELTI